jgi:hypothetical protein
MGGVAVTDSKSRPVAGPAGSIEPPAPVQPGQVLNWPPSWNPWTLRRWLAPDGGVNGVPVIRLCNVLGR